MIEWYLKVVRDNYVNFEGRARRAEYWYFILFYFIIAIALEIVDYLMGIYIFRPLFGLAMLLPSIAAAVRRLHDTGKSGWYFLLIFFAVIGWIWLIVLLATEGDHGPNEYGHDPKNDYSEFDDIGKTETY